MKYYLPIHLDGGNRGCEAITKATSLLLGKENIYALSKDVNLDKFLGIDKYCTLHVDKKESFAFRLFRKFACLFGDYFKPLTYWYHYKQFISSMPNDGVMLSTGGDMMCYDNNQVIYTNDLAKSKGLKTCLWGCSIGKNNLTDEKIATLRKFDLIYARESLTADLLKSIGCQNVCLAPDPAFILEPEVCPLPECFCKDKKVIGLNISNYVVGSYDLQSTDFGKSVKEAIDYLVKQTDYQILLVPHVLWSGQDDRRISESVYDAYKGTGRVSILDSSKLNYCQIRYVISQCYLFIGGRTHSVISAYSTCVPAIAIGYSIKSVGIAQDLQLPNEMVVNSKKIDSNQDLLSSIKFVLANYQKLRTHLENIIPEYVAKVYNIKNEINKI